MGFGTTQGNSQGGGFVGTTAQQASQNFVGSGQSLMNNQSGGYSSGMSGMSSMGGGMGMSGMSGMGGMGMSGMGGGMGGMGGYGQSGRGGQYGMGGMSPQSNPAAQIRTANRHRFPDRVRGVEPGQYCVCGTPCHAAGPALEFAAEGPDAGPYGGAAGNGCDGARSRPGGAGCSPGAHGFPSREFACGCWGRTGGFWGHEFGAAGPCGFCPWKYWSRGFAAGHGFAGFDARGCGAACGALSACRKASPSGTVMVVVAMR